MSIGAARAAMFGASLPVAAGGWVTNLSAASYDSVFFDSSGQDTIPTDIAISSDGTKLYLLGQTGDTVDQYTLSTAYDLSTAVFASKSVSVAAQDGVPRGLDISADGSQMYMLGGGSDFLYQYTLSTPWDISTASYASKSFSVIGVDSNPEAAIFTSDGLACYLVGAVADTIYQLDLGTAWDISTATDSGISLSIAAEDTSPSGLALSPDGGKLYLVGSGTDSIYQYSLPTPGTLTGGSYDTSSYSVAGTQSIPSGICFNPDGSKMYVAGYGTVGVHQHTTG